MRFGSLSPTARLLIPLAVAVIGLVTQEWIWTTAGVVGVIAVVGLRVWNGRTKQPDDGFAGVIAVFLSIAAAFLTGAIYLWVAVGGASAAIIGALAIGVALFSAFLAYLVGYTRVTGKRARSAVWLNALLGYLSRDIHPRL